MSEKSMGNAPDDASEAKKAPNQSAFQPQKGVWPCKIGYQLYNSGESELKKEIPVYKRKTLVDRGVLHEWDISFPVARRGR